MLFLSDSAPLGLNFSFPQPCTPILRSIRLGCSCYSDNPLFAGGSAWRVAESLVPGTLGGFCEN